MAEDKISGSICLKVPEKALNHEVIRVLYEKIPTQGIIYVVAHVIVAEEGYTDDKLPADSQLFVEVDKNRSFFSMLSLRKSIDEEEFVSERIPTRNTYSVVFVKEGLEKRQFIRSEPEIIIVAFDEETIRATFF